MMKKIAAIVGCLWLSIGCAFAQTSPNLTYGQVLTPAQWNQLFINKQDTLGFTPVNAAGAIMTGRLVTAPSSATTSGFNLTPGAAGASPANGDLWVTSSGFFAQVNGVTIGPIGGATSASFANTSPITLSFPSGVVTYACATCGVTGSPLSQFAATTSAQLASTISDETGTGLLVFGTSPTLTTPILGVAAATSINKVAITAPGTSATLTIANGKTLTANNSLTFAGTDATTMTFPGTSDTVAGLAATQTLTNKTISGGTLSGTIAGTPTLSGANFVTLGNIVQDATAWSMLGNASGSTANYAPFTIGGLTSKASIAGTDLIMISDQAASGALKQVTVSQVAAGASVASIDAKTGAFTTGNGIDTSTNLIELTAARRTLPTSQKFTSGSGTYTTPANVLWIEIWGVAGGGGGGGSGASPVTSGTGGNTCWNTTGAACTTPVYLATGGGGTTGSNAGTVSCGAGSSTPADLIPGGAGGTGTATINTSGASGGSSFFGGGGSGGTASSSAASGGGFGAGGGGSGDGGTGGSGGGGAGGCTFHAIINTPASTYTFAVGALGAAGTPGGGAGSVGYITVIEHYGS